MQDALQAREHSPQRLHLSLSMLMRSSEKRERKPRTVPTGHTVLHQVLPPRHASMKMSTKVSAATMNVGRLLIQTSVE